MVSKILRKNIREFLDPVSYDKVVLFGSRARGDYTEKSDFDILVILKFSTGKWEKVKLSTLIRKRFAARMMDVDVLVKDSDDVAYLKDKVGSVVRNALNEGIIL